LGKFTIQLAAVAALVAVSAGVAGAQKAKPPTPRPAGPPVTTHGETKANEHAAKGQATAESKRTEAREDKAARATEKKEDNAERAAIKSARNEPKALLKGIRLSAAERTSVNDIQKKYDGQLKDLEKQENDAEKSGKPDATIVSKIDALRVQERAELRTALTPAQATRFDKNVATLGTKH
jgi:hypothetical protein